MRRPTIVVLILLGAAWALAFVPPSGAQGSVVSVRASHDLDPSPSWWSGEQRTTMGSWAKHSSPVVADLGNGPVIVVGSLGGKVYVLRYTGQGLTRVWDTGGSIDAPIDSSPAIADLDGDGCPEVIVGAGNEYRPHNAGVHIFDCRGGNHRFRPAPGHPQAANHVGVFSTPAVGDVTGDGRPDVVYGSFNQRLYVKHADGSDVAGWEGGKEMYDTIWSSPALADVTGDGRMEIVTGGDLSGAALGCPLGTRGTVSILDHRASFLAGWPKCLDTPVWSVPAVVDLTGNGYLDVVVGTNNYIEGGQNVGRPWLVHAWEAHSGRDLWTASTGDPTRIFSSPAVGDLDGNGTSEVAVATIHPSGSGGMAAFDARTGATGWAWDNRSAGCCVFVGSPVIADVTGNGRPEVVAGGGNGGLYAFDASGGRVVDNYQGMGAGAFFNSAAVADLDGNGRSEIVLASAAVGSNPLRGKVWVLSTPGTGNAPWPAFKRTPDRLGAVGANPPGTLASAPPAGGPPPPAARGGTSRPATPFSPAAPADTEATPGPTDTPEPTAPPRTTPTRRATPPVNEAPPSRLPILALGVAALIASAGAVLLVGRRG